MAKFDPFLSFDCAPCPPPWRNQRKGRDQILPSGNLAYRNKKYYGGAGGASWPDITIRLRLRRQSFVDQKIAVLPIIRKT